jgi:hypothetical protein
MSYAGCNPVLLVEGDGDKDAVPFLLRRMFPEMGKPECTPAPRPIMCGEVKKLKRPGELEKFVEYACRRSDGDSVILTVDCDDDCPKHLVKEFSRRADPIAMATRKKVGIAFMYREFETLFLFSLPELAAAHPTFEWQIEGIDPYRDWTLVRGAKGALNGLMRSYYYKETRDQVRFVSNLDLQQLRAKCRSVEHMFRLLDWLTNPASPNLVYPPP